MDFLTFGWIFVKLDRDRSKVMIVDESGPVAIEKLENDAVSFKVLIAWHFAVIQQLLRHSCVAQQTIFIIHDDSVSSLLSIGILVHIT